MGCCLSKTNSSPKSGLKIISEIHQNDDKVTTIRNFQTTVTPEIEVQKKIPVEVAQRDRKDQVVSVIQHRKNGDGLKDSVGLESSSSGLKSVEGGKVVRTSSCTKEEVDEILIQCGRLSRNSSEHRNGNERRYSGSKRSFDFDREEEGFGNGNEGEKEERLRRRQLTGVSSGRRVSRSPGRRSGSPMSHSGNGNSSVSSGRRVSRSPRKKSESPMSYPRNGNNCVGNGNGNGRPGKLVTIPATVTSLSIDKSNNGNGGDIGYGKRVSVSRNVRSPRRSQSPANRNQVNVSGNGNGKSQSPTRKSLSSENGSRKAEQSPHRRTPLNEIDKNSLPFNPLANNMSLIKGKDMQERKYTAETVSAKTAIQGAHRRRTGSRGAEEFEVAKRNYYRVNDLHTPSLEHLNAIQYDAMATPIILPGTETKKLTPTSGRSRSARQPGDLDINDALLTPTPTSYTSVLLKDIHNFHQNKYPNSNFDLSSASTPVTLPSCLSKTHAILEAVADLNSTTRLDLDPTKKRFDTFVETEVKLGNNLMEPALHKYVTVRKRGGEINDNESSGSNSIVGQQNWVSPSSWEPNSADSTDCWTSKSYSREDEFSPVRFQRHAISADDDSGSKFSCHGRNFQSAPQQRGAAM